MRRIAIIAVSIAVLLACGGGGGFGGAGGVAGGRSKGKSSKKDGASQDGAEVEIEDDENVKADAPAQVSGAFLTACGPVDVPAIVVAAGREAVGCGVYKVPGFIKHTGQVAIGPVVFGDTDGRSEIVEQSAFAPSPAGSNYHVYSSLPAGMPAKLNSVQGTIAVDEQVKGVKIVPQKHVNDWQAVEGIDFGAGEAATGAGAVSDFIFQYISETIKTEPGTTPEVDPQGDVTIKAVEVDANADDAGRLKDGDFETFWSAEADATQTIRLTLDGGHKVTSVTVWPEYGYVDESDNGGGSGSGSTGTGADAISTDSGTETATQTQTDSDSDDGKGRAALHVDRGSGMVEGVPTPRGVVVNAGTVHFKVEVGTDFKGGDTLEGAKTIFDGDVAILRGVPTVLPAAEKPRGSKAIVITMSSCAPSHCALREIKVQE